MTPYEPKQGEAKELLMKYSIHLLAALVVSAIAIAGVSVVISSGCYYQTCDCPPCDGTDGGLPDGGDSDIPVECQAPEEEVGLNAYAEGTTAGGRTFGEEPGNYATVAINEQINLTGVTDPDWQRPELPATCLDPVSYAWDYGNGDTGNGEAVGPITYPANGYYTISMTGSTAAGHRDLTPALTYVTVWDGLFEDDFDRSSIDHDTAGWSYRVADILNLDPSPQWDIQGDQLHANWGPEGFDAYCTPGRQAMLARPEALNATVNVRQSRANPLAEPPTPHYSDIILRYQFRGETPMGPDSPFYRMRVHEAAAVMQGNDCIFIDVFRIDVAGQEFGTAIETEDSYYLCDWPLGGEEALDIEVTIQGTSPVQITATISSTVNPGTYTLTHTFEDSSDTRIVDPGRFGVSQCWGETFFDDFSLESLD